MRRLFVIVATVLGLILASCNSDSVSATGQRLPSPAPAPTIVGESVELEVPAMPGETVLIGIPATEAIRLHALPGVDQPLAGDVAAGTAVEPLGEAFETEDGRVWWLVRAGSLQGWVQPTVAYRGPAVDITDQAVASLEPGVRFGSPEAAAQAIADTIGVDQGASNIIVVSTSEIETPPSATVTVDLLGITDDSVLGFRLIVASAAATGWTPVSVIQAPLCARGLTPEGLCL